MFIVLATYVMAQRLGFGWEAALMTCLITTTVGIMGPGFFIPVAMALLFVPLSLFVLFNFMFYKSPITLDKKCSRSTCWVANLHAFTERDLCIKLV